MNQLITRKLQRFDIDRIRADFALIDQGRIAYLDNAATTQKPASVIRAIQDYYQRDNANVHRATHSLARRATTLLEDAREQVRSFINAPDKAQILWTKGTTEGINLVASSYGGMTLRENDVILLTALEHHSNIVPWQLVAASTGARIRVIPVMETGELDLDAFERLLGEGVRILALGHVSNALGTVNPARTMIQKAREHGVITLIDGAQAPIHLDVDVQDLDCDFYAFSGHKMLGPTGIGVLYGRRELLEAMPPYQGGGEMIETVSFERTTYNCLPYKFEAGTPNIADAIGLATACEYLQSQDRDALTAHEQQLIRMAESGLSQIKNVRLIGAAAERTAILSFTMAGCHPQDLGILLDEQDVAVRTGHHCAMPLMAALQIPGTVRASICLYNSEEDIERLIRGVEGASRLFTA